MAEIKCIARSDNLNPGDPAIIFIHGLGGDARETWMQDKNNEETLWPKWLADEAGLKCSVFLLGYDAALSKWKDSAMPLPNQGDAALELLSSEPQLRNRPLILIGHSMGGLVIKTLIQNGLSKGVQRYKNTVEQIRGVVFIGTPHKGSQLATLAKYLSLVLRTNTQVKNMQNHDPYLGSLNQQFLAYYNNPPQGRVSVLTFAETQGVFLGKKIVGARFGPTKLIVDYDSSEPHVPGEIAISLPEDHISMCKLADRDQQLYKSLLRFLKEDVDLTVLPDESKPEGSEAGGAVQTEAPAADQPNTTTVPLLN